MHGANISQFRLFRDTKDGYDLVLQSGAHDLIIMDKRWLGIREVELLSATGIAVHTVRLRFDGKRYRAFSDHWESTQ